MSIVAWEEPVEDISDAPTVIYDDGRPVRWLNHEPADLIGDPEFLLHNPHPGGPQTFHSTRPSGGGAFYDALFSDDPHPEYPAFWPTWTPPVEDPDPLGDMQRAWDALAADFLNTSLRRAR